MSKFICFVESEYNCRLAVSANAIKSFGVVSNYDEFAFILRFGDGDHEVLELQFPTEDAANHYYETVRKVISDPSPILEVFYPLQNP